MDCVLGYHLNPMTCGVAKFNSILARQMSVPVKSVLVPMEPEYREPLLSLKVSEFKAEDLPGLEKVLDAFEGVRAFQLFLHEFTGTAVEVRLVRKAARVYCGNSEIVAQLRELRPDAVEAWCPGTLLETRRFEPAEISVFSFGMAHKVRTDFYARLRDLLERTGHSYCLYLSTALHDNTTFDGPFTRILEQMRALFEDRMYFLGFLSDSAIYNYLKQATFFAGFFERGVRSNNTSVHAAMHCGCVVITNFDRYSPASLVHLQNVLDIERCSALPTDRSALAELGARALETAHRSGWAALASMLRGHPHAERLPGAIARSDL